MSVTFFIALVVALLALVYWRIVLLVVLAILLAMVVTGISAVTSAVAGHDEQTAVLAPGLPGVQPAEPPGVPGDTSNGLPEDPQAEGGAPG
jgi:hypothetical protein